jgi:hypothetical protein
MHVYWMHVCPNSWLPLVLHGAHCGIVFGNSNPHPHPHTRFSQITLVDQSDRFVFKPLLYELINGTAAPWEVAPRFEQLLGPYSVTFLQVRVCIRLCVHVCVCGRVAAPYEQAQCVCTTS